MLCKLYGDEHHPCEHCVECATFCVNSMPLTLLLNLRIQKYVSMCGSNELLYLTVMLCVACGVCSLMQKNLFHRAEKVQRKEKADLAKRKASEFEEKDIGQVADELRVAT